MPRRASKNGAKRKMTHAEAGRIGGLAEKAEPADRIVGDKVAKGWAQQVGKVEVGRPPRVCNLYRDNPKIVILIAERVRHYHTSPDKSLADERGAWDVVKLCRQRRCARKGYALDEVSTSRKQYLFESTVMMTAREVLKVAKRG